MKNTFLISSTKLLQNILDLINISILEIVKTSRDKQYDIFKKSNKIMQIYWLKNMTTRIHYNTLLKPKY